MQGYDYFKIEVIGVAHTVLQFYFTEEDHYRDLDIKSKLVLRKYVSAELTWLKIGSSDTQNVHE
jgi:hypothetical protein